MAALGAVPAGDTAFYGIGAGAALATFTALTAVAAGVTAVGGGAALAAGAAIAAEPRRAPDAVAARNPSLTPPR